LTDQAKTTDERLALAVSGWIVGANLATSDVQEAARMAKHRSLIQKMLEPLGVDEFEIGLDALAREGVDAALASHLIPYLPAPPMEIAPGEVSEIEEEGVRYRVLLPKEYDRLGRHPLVVSLHGIHSTPKEQIEFWKPAVDAGMIVIAPAYLLGEDQPYEYSSQEHDRVLAVLADARRRFAVDSNRVFLAGHEVGGYAVFDIGMSHPDEFAGMVSFSGVPMYYAQYYWRNIGHLPIYAVEGSLNGGNPAAIRSNFARFFQKGYPAVYVEYAGRGGGMFAAELPKILQWMETKTRDPFPTEVEAMSARHSDRRFYWLEADAYRPGSTIAPKLFDKKKGLKPAKMSGSRDAANTLAIQTSGLDSVNVLLSPRLLQLDDPKLTVKVNRRVIHAGPIEPNLGVLLRTVRKTGDRQRLVVAVLRAGI
jgi:acetyl esterase/lipase